MRVENKFQARRRSARSQIELALIAGGVFLGLLIVAQTVGASLAGI